MPKLYTDHRNAVRLERELAEIWDVLDKLGVREGRLRALTRGTPGGPAALLTTKGDLLTRDASQDAVLRAGADNEILTADAAEAVGMKWSSSLADHLADTVDPHGAIMTVSTKVITPEIKGGAGVVLNASFAPADSFVIITNDEPGREANLVVDKNINLGGEVNGRDVAADGTKLDAIETNADVTDASNVNAAGAVMESDFNANTILAANADDTPAPVTIAVQRIVGRITAGNIKGMTAAEVRTLISVADGADVTGSNPPQAHAATHVPGGADVLQVSATDKLLGRSTAGAGPVEEIPCTAVGRALIDDADAAAQRTTLDVYSRSFVIAMAVAL